MFDHTPRWAALLGLLLIFAFAPTRADEPIKVVYHVMDTDAQGLLAMGNIRNHLRADPSAKITLVALFKGINLFLKKVFFRK